MVCNGLLIANVGENVIKYRQRGFLSRNRNSRLGHKRQQAYSLENHGFASGIWAADNQNSSIGIHVQRNRCHRAVFAPEVIFQQRMACLDEAEQQAWGKARDDAIEIA